MKIWYMKRSIFAASVVALTLVMGFAAIVSADTGARNSFVAEYPTSPLGGSCSICHGSGSNPYRTALVNAGGKASSISHEQFVAVQALDSDGDGFSNLAEITAGTYPGDRNSFPSVLPEIDPIDPAEGTLGTELTITGSGLGAKKGKVVLSNDLGSTTTLKIASGGWTSERITATLGKALPPGEYDVQVYLQPFKTTSPIPAGTFTLMIPELDLPLQPVSGPPGMEITIDGWFFGTKKGKVYINGEKKGIAKNQSCKVTFWSMDTSSGESHLRFLVPKTLDPGEWDLTVINTVGSSAIVKFTIEPLP